MRVQKERFAALLAAITMAALVLLSACAAAPGSSGASASVVSDAQGGETLGGVIPEELEYIPDGYTGPASQQGTLERLDYETWESFSYAQKTQRLTKTAWVYLPYGYDGSKQYNILYLSHGGWSNETSLMGTPEEPHDLKHIIDHAIQDGKVQPLIICDAAGWRRALAPLSRERKRRIHEIQNPWNRPDRFRRWPGLHGHEPCLRRSGGHTGNDGAFGPGCGYGVYVL